MIPTGWIHAVYTPVDSLVFGGNFLHGFNIEGQLAIAELERRLRVRLAQGVRPHIGQVPDQYKFPFFERIMWYAANKFQHSLQVDHANSG